MKKYLTTGLIAVIPVAVLGWVISIVYNLIATLVGNHGPEVLLVGALIGIAGVFILGFMLIHSRFIRKIQESIEQLIIDKTPLAKTVYKFSKDIAENALDNKTYEKVVKAYPFGRTGSGMIGFLVCEKTSTVFIPSSPSPFTGQVYYECEHEILEDWNYDDVIKYGLSVGMSQK